MRGKRVFTAVHVVKGLDLCNGAYSTYIKNLTRKCAIADIAADDARHVREGSYPFRKGDIESVAFHAARISQRRLRWPQGTQCDKRRGRQGREGQVLDYFHSLCPFVWFFVCFIGLLVGEALTVSCLHLEQRHPRAKRIRLDELSAEDGDSSLLSVDYQVTLAALSLVLPIPTGLKDGSLDALMKSLY
jgi:hypothetical protein